MSDPLTTDPVSHTPGPWWVERRVGDALQVNAKHRGEGSSYCVASVNHWEGEADHANARLIAAVPDLLELLKEATGLAAVGDIDADSPGGWGEWFKAACDAIAKAEGRS